MKKINLPNRKFTVNNVEYELKVIKEQLSDFDRLYSCLILDKYNNAVLHFKSLLFPHQNIDEDRLLTAIVNICSDAIGKDGLFDLKKQFIEPTTMELCGYKFGVKFTC